jgi:NADPH:quinone reductase-like Zn-dependent oxidoreductase
MKAIVYTQYGSPDVLRLQEVEKPTPADNEVLVKVHAASANPLDWHIMRGAPFLARLEFGLFKPKHAGLGADVAGRVEAVGKNVTRFQPGDEVFGDIFGSGLGSFAEYASVSENDLALKPANLSFEEAASTPIVGFTALQGLRDTGHIQAGQTVLVNGASGGVGTFAAQLAKSFDTEVTGVCSARNFDMVRSIGADHVIDYTQEDFTDNGRQYDLIFDMVGNRTASDLARALKPGGTCVIGGFANLGMLFNHMVIAPRMSKAEGKTVGMMKTAHANQPDLLFIKDLLETGKVKPVIDRCYPLSETAEAIRYLETGRARGKVVISVEPGNPS